MKDIKLVALDLDGTLFDNGGRIATRCLQQCAERKQRHPCRNLHRPPIEGIHLTVIAVGVDTEHVS